MTILVRQLKGVSSILMLDRAQLQMKVTAELPGPDFGADTAGRARVEGDGFEFRGVVGVGVGAVRVPFSE